MLEERLLTKLLVGIVDSPRPPLLTRKGIFLDEKSNQILANCITNILGAENVGPKLDIETRRFVEQERSYPIYLQKHGETEIAFGSLFRVQDWNLARKSFPYQKAYLTDASKRLLAKDPAFIDHDTITLLPEGHSEISARFFREKGVYLLEKHCLDQFIERARESEETKELFQRDFSALRDGVNSLYTLVTLGKRIDRKTQARMILKYNGTDASYIYSHGWIIVGKNVRSTTYLKTAYLLKGRALKIFELPQEVKEKTNLLQTLREEGLAK